MWEIRSIDLGARAAFVATLRFYIRALVMKKEKGERRLCPLCSNSGQNGSSRRMTLSAKSGHRTLSLKRKRSPPVRKGGRLRR